MTKSKMSTKVKEDQFNLTDSINFVKIKNNIQLLPVCGTFI